MVIIAHVIINAMWIKLTFTYYNSIKELWRITWRTEEKKNKETKFRSNYFKYFLITERPTKMCFGNAVCQKQKKRSRSNILSNILPPSLEWMSLINWLIVVKVGISECKH